MLKKTGLIFWNKKKVFILTLKLTQKKYKFLNYYFKWRIEETLKENIIVEKFLIQCIHIKEIVIIILICKFVKIKNYFSIVIKKFLLEGSISF